MNPYPSYYIIPFPKLHSMLNLFQSLEMILLAPEESALQLLDSHILLLHLQRVLLYLVLSSQHLRSQLLK